MNAIICSVEENKLIRLITVRQFCASEITKHYAISTAVSIMEKVEKEEDLRLYEGQCVGNTENIFSYMPIEVSYSVFYQTEKAKEKFLDFIKNLNK